LKKEFILFVLFSLFAGINLLAQNPYIQEYTTKDGLPSGTVYQVYSDSKQFIWFATDAGVARYDGSIFTSYSKKNGLNSNEIVKIKEDEQGRLWFFNLNGSMNYFYQNKIYNKSNAPFLSDLESKHFFRNFFQDTDSTIYFYTHHSREIFSLDAHDQVKIFIFPSKPFKRFSIVREGMAVYFIHKTSKEGFLLWARSGLYTLNDFREEPRLVSDDFYFREGYKLNADKYVIHATSKSDTTRWMFTYTGDSLVLSMKNHVMSNFASTSVIEADDGVYWFATYEYGIFIVKNNSIINRIGLNEAQAVIQDHEGNIWVTSVNNRVLKISPSYNVHTHIETTEFRNSGISALCAYPGGVWMTNGQQIYLYNSHEILLLDFIDDESRFNQLYYLDDKTLITGEKSVKFHALIDVEPDRSTKQIRYKYHSNKRHYGGIKNIAISPVTDEIFSFSQSFILSVSNENYFKEIEEIDIGERIHNIFFNLDNDLIINAKKNYIFQDGKAFPYQQLSAFNNKIITGYLQINDSIEVYNVEGDSIYISCNNRIYSLTKAINKPIDLMVTNMAYHKPSLFLSTVHNIFVCDHPEEIIDDGEVELTLMNINFGKINDMLVFSDTLFVASDDGLTIIPDASLRDVKTKIPIPYFRSVQLNGTEANLAQKELLLTGENKINFSFSCVNYSSSPVVYSYQLVGLDPGWTVGTANEVVYQNLDKGSYVFRVKAQKPGTEFSTPVDFKIEVSATLWEQPLFYVGLFLLVSGLIIWAILTRIRRQKVLLEMDNQLIILEQKALQSMMNPHFIFNAFSSIQNYLLQKKAEEASSYVSKFARLIRQNLNATNSNMIKLDEEINRIKNYLELEQLRMEHKFEYKIEFDAGIEEEELMIPSMIIQPFVENAVWHGVSAIGDKGRVGISFSLQEPGTLIIAVEDNGVGIKNTISNTSYNERHLNLGAKMTRKRLEILGKKLGTKTSIQYFEKYPGSSNPGTRVVLTVPVSYHSTKEMR